MHAWMLLYNFNYFHFTGQGKKHCVVLTRVLLIFRMSNVLQFVSIIKVL